MFVMCSLVYREASYCALIYYISCMYPVSYIMYHVSWSYLEEDEVSIKDVVEAIVEAMEYKGEVLVCCECDVCFSHVSVMFQSCFQ